MDNNSLYNTDIWERFCKKFGGTAEEFELKTYPQLDPFFNFFEDKIKIQKLVSDPTLKSVAKHSFIPFVKILTKTPRYRWQENEKEYMLETKIRPIAFASHFDTYLYAFYSFALTEKYQQYIRTNKFHECVLAYRTDLEGKCNIQFAKEVFDSIKTKLTIEKTCSVIALDITGYFDNIDHAKLKEKWCQVLDLPELPIDQYKIFRSLTQYTYVNKDSILTHFNIDLNYLKENGIKWQTLLDLIPNKIAGSSFKEKFDLLRDRKLIITNLPKKSKEGLQYRGIPQGSAMSALLSNIYLIDFDRWLWNESKKQNFTYKRYCDDLIVVCNSEIVDEINKSILAKISEYNLEIQDRKTELIEFRKNSKGKIRSFNRKMFSKTPITLTSFNEEKYYKNLQYLGFEFNGQNIYIRPGSLSRYFRKMKGRIIKTVMMSYSNKSDTLKIKKRQIYFRYSHFGPRNFITYAKNASKVFYDNSEGVSKPGMNSKSIQRQIASHVEIIETEIRKKSHQRFEHKKHIRAKKKEKGKRQKFIPLKR
jgi:RNA-directed DNA polymerase